MVMPKLGLLSTIRAFVERGGHHVASLYCMRNSQSSFKLHGTFTSSPFIRCLSVLLSFFRRHITTEAFSLDKFSLGAIKVPSDPDFSLRIIQFSQITCLALISLHISIIGLIVAFLTLIVPTIFTVSISRKISKNLRFLAGRALFVYDCLRHGGLLNRLSCLGPSFQPQTGRWLDLFSAILTHTNLFFKQKLLFFSANVALSVFATGGDWFCNPFPVPARFYIRG